MPIRSPEHRRVAVGDVAERAGVDDDRRVLQRLQEVGLDRLAHDDGHRAGAVELLGGDRVATRRVADDDPAESGPQVLERRGQRQDRHHLGRRGDVEAGLADHAVGLVAEADDDVAQRPVVDVEDPPPCDVVLVEVEGVALVEVAVEHRRQQVVGRRDGVEVAGQVQVELLHRDDLAVATTGGAALDAERRAHRGLAQADHRLAADAGHRLAESDRGGGLALAERRGRDRRDDDVLGRWAVGELVDRLQPDLRQARPVRLQQVLTDAELGGDLGQRLVGSPGGRCPGPMAVPRSYAFHHTASSRHVESPTRTVLKRFQGSPATTNSPEQLRARGCRRMRRFF